MERHCADLSGCFEVCATTGDPCKPINLPVATFIFNILKGADYPMIRVDQSVGFFGEERECVGDVLFPLKVNTGFVLCDVRADFGDPCQILSGEF